MILRTTQVILHHKTSVSMPRCSNCNNRIDKIDNGHTCYMCGKAFCADCFVKADYPSVLLRRVYHKQYGKGPAYSNLTKSNMLCKDCAKIFKERIDLLSRLDKSPDLEISFGEHQVRKNDYNEDWSVVESNWDTDIKLCRSEIQLLAKLAGATKLVMVSSINEKKHGQNYFKMDGIAVKHTMSSNNKEWDNSKHESTVMTEADKHMIGTMVRAKIIRVAQNGRFFCQSTTFDLGVVLSENLVYQGTPVPADIYDILFKNLSQNVGSYFDAKVLNIFWHNGEKVAFLGYDLFTNNAEDKNVFDSLQIDSDYEMEVFSIGGQIVQLRYPGTSLRGYIEKDAFDQRIRIGDKFNMTLSSKGQNPLQLMRFMIAVENPLPKLQEKPEDYDATARFEEFFPEIERNSLSAEDKEMALSILSRYPEMAFNKFLSPNIHIYCKYKGDMESGWKKYTAHHHNGLQNSYFFINYNTDRNELVLFNSDSLQLVMNLEAKELKLKELYYDRKDTKVPNIIYNYKNRCLKVRGSNVHILDVYKAIPHDYDARIATTAIIEQKHLYYDIKYKAEKAARETRLIQGKYFHILKDVLRYQKMAEEQKSGDEVTVSTSAHIKRSQCQYYTDGIGFKFDLNRADVSKLSNEEENDMYVSILDAMSKPVRTGQLFYEDENEKARLEFPANRGIDSSLIMSGFTMKRKSAVEHLDLQISAIQEFVHNKKDQFFDKILSGHIKIPDTSKYKNIEFCNPIFKHAKKDNNQLDAVRKALGNKDVVLIQGPPGTGKTTVIVEIIQQLVKEGKKVLVCSQAHAAVDNIVKKLSTTDKKLSTIEKLSFLSIDNEGEAESWGENFDLDDYRHFLEHNAKLSAQLNKGVAPDILLEQIDHYSYRNTKSAEKYHVYHCSMIKNYATMAAMLKISSEVYERLNKDDVNLGANVLETYRYQSMDVILGTCIGIGMNKILKSDSIHFDTVIIDEAAKANLAETLVPMAKADRYVLVGDHKQLPPYLDREMAQDYFEYNNGKANKDSEDAEDSISTETVEDAMSKSLFELLTEGSYLPADNITLLNYQFRMHPDIGRFISEVFYNGEVMMGEGTHAQLIDLPAPYDKQCVFVETDVEMVKGQWVEFPNEECLNNSWVNYAEVNIICNEIVPLIQQACLRDISIGIITPYRSQRDELRKRLENTEFKQSVYTIDSIQGMEFDIVIFSFVRSFPAKKMRTVGFLDDMRRLNVSMSRAKKKLILVGNKQTLINPAAHRDNERHGFKKPVDVFRALTKETVVYREIKKARMFHEKYHVESLIKCNFIKIKKGKIYFCISDDTSFKFNMPLSKTQHLPVEELTGLLVKYVKDDDAYRPLFELYSYMTEQGEIKAYTLKDLEMLRTEAKKIKVVVKEIKENFIKVDFCGYEGVIYENKVMPEYFKEAEKDQILEVYIWKIDTNGRKFVCNPLKYKGYGNKKVNDRRYEG